MVKKMLISLGVAIVLILIIAGSYLLKTPDAPKPTGPYKIGFSEFMLTDEMRQETFSTDTTQKRRIMIKAWYPAKPDAGSKPMFVHNKYQKEVSLAMNKLMKIPTNPLDGLNKKRNNTYFEAPFDESKSSWPTVLFSHGYGFGFDTQNWTTMEELASHGYIVFSISHPYEGLVSVFEDGSRAYCRASFLEELEEMQKPAFMKNYVKAFEKLTGSETQDQKQQAMQELSQNYYSQYKESITIWKADTTLLLDHLQTNRVPERFQDAVERNQLGIFGHSFGGLIAGEMCLSDDRLKAGINLDAPQINYDAAKPYHFKAPMLFMYSTSNDYMKGVSLDLSNMNTVVDGDSQQPTYHVSIDDSAHYNYSDMSLGPQLLKHSPMLGKIDGTHMLQIMNKAIVLFFNKYVKEEHIDFEKSLKIYEDVSL